MDDIYMLIMELEGRIDERIASKLRISFLDNAQKGKEQDYQLLNDAEYLLRRRHVGRAALRKVREIIT